MAEGYQMTETILGMPGPWARNNYEVSDHYTTKIGGLPDWPFAETDIDPDLLQCAICGKSLCLAAQVYAPVVINGLKIEERTIYILGCIVPECGSNPNSWCTLRVQQSYNVVETSSTTKEDLVPLAPSSSDNWWEVNVGAHSSSEEDDGSEDDFDLQELGKALAQAACRTVHPKREAGQPNQINTTKLSPLNPQSSIRKANRPVAPCFYIYSQEEPSCTYIGSGRAYKQSLSVDNNNRSDTDDQGDEKWDQESYEYDRAPSADRMYLKYKKRVDANPDQCFRYSYGGRPLLAATKLHEPGVCNLCGASRHYEMQLMPPLLYFIQEGADGLSTHSPKGWDWMTLIVYTCSESCSQQANVGEGDGGWFVAKEETFVQYEDASDHLAQLSHNSSAPKT
ncbi:hypothetical protein H6P81_019901 [Aristolochia fimbriata]|uniref:Programmed cell death protein 2 C-terminal domain-containing protein n=1 Tax=Aristolochia fimbriata TaxID=158543 RepID=A0AAV7DW82_ARIFI|nr:hypothetical protein H6P81_019901 [Aristolochia fimbriata]